MRVLTAALAWLWGAAAMAADAPALILEHFTKSDGLPQATVMATLQDSQGFVWFGTEDGLVRFDGDKLQRYAHVLDDNASLPGNFVWDIAEDANHDLWIATKDSGLARWNRRTDTFTRYRHDPGAPSRSLASDSLRTLLVDSRGRVWVGTTDAGVDILDPVTGTFEHLRRGDLSGDRVYALAPSRGGGVWIATGSGLDLALPDGSGIRPFATALRDAEVTSVLEDRSGAVWVGIFDHGLMRFDSAGNLQETFRHDAQRDASIASNEVRAILEDSAGHLWIGTTEGLDLLDRSSHDFIHYGHQPSDPDSLRDSYVMSLYQDAAGLVWIGTRTGGVSRWNPRSWELGAHRPSWLGNEPVVAFADAADGEVWISTMGGVLVRFNSNTGAATSIDDVVKRRDALNGARVMSLLRDRRGTVWIGTMANGVMTLDADGRLQSLPVKPGDPRSVSASGIMRIVETRDGRIWIGTYGGGANVIDPISGSVRQLPFSANSDVGTGPNVTSIAEDTDGNLWFGTDGNGVSVARGDGSVLKSFRHDVQDPKSLPVNTIYAISADDKGRVWLGTDGGGLVRVNGSAASAEAIRFSAMTRAQGLTSDTLYGIVPDATGALWLSGNSGLMRYNPETRAIKTYHREHGLQGEEFFSNAYFRLRDGRIAFGGGGGFNLFDPQRLTENRQPPRLVLTSVEVLGVPAAGPVPFWLRDQVALDYRGSIVSLDFGVLDFSSPRHNRLSYRVPGLTDQWIDLGGQRRITLTNLDPGEHTLEVRAANADSVWSQTPLRVKIRRDPAPWASPLAYALYALLVLGFVAYRIHRHRVKFQEVAAARDRLETEVQLRTRELVESNRQLAEAARAKSDFLDRMSHELRTPMNGVVGMTELLSRTALSATQTHLTKTIRSSAQILLQIVNDLLDLSKIRAGKVQLERLPIDLGQVLEECTSLFAGAAENKGIELIVCPPPRSERALLGDPLRVRQILMNLVGNAVKFTSVGEVVVRADVESVEGDQALVKVRVTDTGIGMDAAAISKIFEPFSQADETTTRKFGGTGLGLAICRELAEIMGARITVESKPQIGSTFCLALPLAIGDALPSSTSALPSKRVKVMTRRASLEESLTRHAASFGMTVGDGDADVVVLDAGTYRSELTTMLAGSDAARSGLIVMATASEVEKLGLRVLLHEKAIVLKPVHRIALQEALAVAVGAELGVSAARPTTSKLSGHVLLVEDEAVNAAVAEGYLGELGCTAVWVKSGEEAIARSATERFDLILMDLNMPGMDGFAAVKRIREREALQGSTTRIPVIALTAHDAASYRARCLEGDMDDILSKPYALDECTVLLRRWLPASRAAAEASAAHEGANAKAQAGVPAQAQAPAATPYHAQAQDSEASTAAGSPALAAVDHATVAALKKLRGGTHPDLFSKLVELFRTGSTDSLDSLQSAVEARDLRSAAAICHKLAASAANVGALAYARQVRELERLCAAGDASQVDEIYSNLDAAHAPLIDALNAYTMRASA